MPTSPVDFYASLDHYADHLAPVWFELGEHAGTFWCQPRVAPHLRALGIAARPGRPKGPRRLVCVAGGSDAYLMRAFPVALVEHGAGQAYDVPDLGWSGGPGRDSVVLFLTPNEVAAQRNRDAYPEATHVVVGSPRVEALRSAARRPGDGEATAEQPTRERQPSGPVVVALAFHWMGSGRVPEAGWALPHYEAQLPEIVAQLRGAGCEVIGHGHPRARQHFRRLWRSVGVEFVERFDDVVSRATVYVCDNSSTIFEWAALDRPVVVLNAPWYRRGVEMWPRFWTCADVGVQVSEPSEVVGAVTFAAMDPAPVAKRRRECVAEVYGRLDGRAARRSADALLRVAAAVE